MIESDQDKNTIENLLKALSIEEAIKIFTEIDKRILQLINCSTDDFLSLNEHFKNYHKESKKIAQNASNIIQLLTDSRINNSFVNLKKFGERFNAFTKIFTQRIEYLDIELKKISNKLENLKIAHNNYRQDLISLKMLLVNFNFEGVLSDHKRFFKNKSEEIENKTEVIKVLILNADNLIEELNDIAMESYVLLDTIKKDNYEHLQKLNDNIETGFTLFNKKYSEASAMFPSLKELSDKNSSNIAKIITNLQYHDIIQQKIEHIKRTHKDIIIDLQSYSDSDKSLILLHNKAKTFLKIRDIAGLQAAQLIHANRQYQMAIEEISFYLEDIGNDMIVINRLCENLVGKTDLTNQFYLNNIIDNLDKALNFNIKLANSITQIKLLTHSLSNKNKEYLKISKEIHIQKESIKEILKELSVKIGPSKSFSENSSISQLNKLLEETNFVEQNINEIQNELNQKIAQIVSPQENFLVETNILHDLNDLSYTLPGLIELLKESIKKIDEYLSFNSFISHNISDHIKNSLKKIKYYVLFEKVSINIIGDLNSINLKLNYGNELTNKEENLKHLKKRYTMASEHIIHDHITKIPEISELTNKKNENKIIDIANQNSEIDDENLELF